MNRPNRLYYIAHRDNLKSILKKGILSHHSAEKWGLLGKINSQKKQLFMIQVLLKIRKDKELNGKSLLDYAQCVFSSQKSYALPGD